MPCLLISPTVRPAGSFPRLEKMPTHPVRFARFRAINRSDAWPAGRNHPPWQRRPFRFNVRHFFRIGARLICCVFAGEPVLSDRTWPNPPFHQPARTIPKGSGYSAGSKFPSGPQFTEGSGARGLYRRHGEPSIMSRFRRCSSRSNSLIAAASAAARSGACTNPRIISARLPRISRCCRRPEAGSPFKFGRLVHPRSRHLEEPSLKGLV